MHFLGGNADLRTETEFATVGKLSREIGVNASRIDFFQKSVDGFLVARDDCLGVTERLLRNVGERLVERTDDF